MSADGTRFFYVNPLGAEPKLVRARFDLEHVKTRRVEWFGCACCPPNVARLIGSIGAYAYAYDDSSIWLHNYIAGTARFPSKSGELRLSVETDYPWDGRVLLKVLSGCGRRTIRLRVPSWSDSFISKLNGKSLDSTRLERGYLTVDRDWKAGDEIEIELDMSVHFIYSRPEVAETIGKSLRTKGPRLFSAPRRPTTIQDWLAWKSIPAAPSMSKDVS